MPDPTFLGLVRFGGGPGCPCGGPIQGWRKVRAYKARHGWPLFDSETVEAYLTQEVSGEGIGSYGATRTINPLTGLSDGAPWVYVPGQGDWFPDVGYFLMEPSPAVLPIGKHRDSEFDQVQVGQVTLSNPYTFGRLQSDLSEILRLIGSGISRSARRTRASGWMPTCRRAATECWVGLVFSSPLGAR